MAALRTSVYILLIVGTLCIGSSFAAHETNQVPMPEGTTIWMVCMDTPEVIEHHYIGCYMQLDTYMQGAGNGISAQCTGLEILNECIKTNVSLHCPDLYRQYYRDMSSFMPTVVLFCGSTLGLVTIEEWEHIVWIRYNQLYLEYLAMMSSTQTPDVTTAADVDDVNDTANVTNQIDVVNSTSHAANDVNGTANATNDEDVDDDVGDDVGSGDDDNQMVTRRMKNDIRNVTERFMTATTAAPMAAVDQTTPPKRVSLMEVLTTAAASQSEEEATD